MLFNLCSDTLDFAQSHPEHGIALCIQIIQIKPETIKIKYINFTKENRMSIIIYFNLQPTR